MVPRLIIQYIGNGLTFHYTIGATTSSVDLASADIRSTGTDRMSKMGHRRLARAIPQFQMLKCQYLPQESVRE